MSTQQTDTTSVKPETEPRCFNVQFSDVTAADLCLRDARISGLDKVVVDVGPLYISFDSRAVAREFFARGVELVDKLEIGVSR